MRKAIKINYNDQHEDAESGVIITRRHSRIFPLMSKQVSHCEFM